MDARTIMTAMSLSTLARGTMVAAEILDAKMDQYLKIAHVTEIIYSREYSRLPWVTPREERAFPISSSICSIPRLRRASRHDRSRNRW